MKGNKKDEKDESSIEYTIEKLLKNRRRKGIWKIHVKWEGRIETTWEVSYMK